MLVVPLVSGVSSQSAFAGSTLYDDEYGEVHKYVLSSGETVEYFLDENGIPFEIKNQEKVILLLPLDHLLVKDPQIIQQLKINQHNI